MATLTYDYFTVSDTTEYVLNADDPDWVNEANVLDADSDYARITTDDSDADYGYYLKLYDWNSKGSLPSRYQVDNIKIKINMRYDGASPYFFKLSTAIVTPGDLDAISGPFAPLGLSSSFADYVLVNDTPANLGLSQPQLRNFLAGTDPTNCYRIRVNFVGADGIGVNFDIQYVLMEIDYTELPPSQGAILFGGL